MKTLRGTGASWHPSAQKSNHDFNFMFKIEFSVCYRQDMRRNSLPEKSTISKAGAEARRQLIEAAGEVFAEKGFQGATSREICLRAGVNLAAVNYHFGGFEALYVATLKEAHQRVNWAMPAEIAGFGDLAPKDKLRTILRSLVARLSQSTAKSWDMRLISRELVLPSFAQAEFVATSIEPRRAILKAIIGEIIGRPADDPLVARCLLTTIAPSILLSMVDRATVLTLQPELGSGTAGIEALVDHFERFVLGGLGAIVEAEASRR